MAQITQNNTTPALIRTPSNGNSSLYWVNNQVWLRTSSGDDILIGPSTSQSNVIDVNVYNATVAEPALTDYFIVFLAGVTQIILPSAPEMGTTYLLKKAPGYGDTIAITASGAVVENGTSYDWTGTSVSTRVVYIGDMGLDWVLF